MEVIEHRGTFPAVCTKCHRLDMVARLYLRDFDKEVNLCSLCIALLTIRAQEIQHQSAEK